MNFPTFDSLHDRSKIFYVKSDGIYYPIDIHQLSWIVTKGNYCTLFMDNGSSYIVRSSLSNFLNAKSLGILTQIHRSYIINFHKIKYYNPLGTVKIGEEEIPVSKNYKKKLEEQIQFFNPINK